MYSHPPSVLSSATVVLTMRTNESREVGDECFAEAKQMPQLVEKLFGAYRRHILALLLLRPDESFHVREIARLTGVSVGSLHRELKLLTETGLLQRSLMGNQVRYQAEQNCEIYSELAGIFRKTAGMADILRDLLAPMRAQISLALVFGSIANGKAQTNSDIDLLVVGSVSFTAVVEACHAGTRYLRREVNPVVMSETAFQAKFRENDRFISRIAREEKIILIGDVHEFGKFGEDRAA